MPILHRILPRALWDALARKYAYQLPVYPVTEIYIHHGASTTPTSATDGDGDGAPDAEEAVWRSYQRYHMITRGYSDIAYNFGVGQSGQIYEGRGWRNQGGATGNGKDRHSLSICAIGNFGVTPPSDKMMDAIVGWIVTGIEKGHVRPDVKIYGHRDAYETTCPGGYLYSHLPRIRSEVADGRVPEENDVIPFDEWRTHYNELAYGAAPDGVVEYVQDRLHRLGYDPGPVDGIKGPATDAAVVQFELDNDHNGDNKFGPPSWETLINARVEVQTIPPTVKTLIEELWGEVN